MVEKKILRPQTLSSRVVYRGYFNLHTDLLRKPDGKTADHTSIIVAWDAVVILAEDSSGRLILNREYRHAPGVEILGCPGGKLEKGESPLIGGKRELLEETGYASDDVQLIGSCYAMPGLCNQMIHYLYAKNATLQKPQQLDPFEFIETELMTEEELKAAICHGRVIDSILCTALLYKSLMVPKS